MPPMTEKYHEQPLFFTRYDDLKKYSSVAAMIFPAFSFPYFDGVGCCHRGMQTLASNRLDTHAERVAYIQALLNKLLPFDNKKYHYFSCRIIVLNNDAQFTSSFNFCFIKTYSHTT